MSERQNQSRSLFNGWNGQCWHVYISDGNSERIVGTTAWTERLSAIGEYFCYLQHKKEIGGEDFGLQLVIDYWKRRPGTVDRLLVQAALSLAATVVVLDGCIGAARAHVHLAILLEHSLQVGAEEFWNNPFQSRPLLKVIQNISTEREVILFLKKKIRCSCLDEKAHQVIAQPKMDQCSYCKKVDVKENIQKCGQCKIFRYCSKDCQRADWNKGHRNVCKLLAKSSK